jgi:protein-tyrosine-phosphatase
MTVHFAAARNITRSPVARALSRRVPGRAANDNGDLAGIHSNDQLIHAALRHFASHGLGAAREARKQAEAAFFDGDRRGYDWWLGICRTLDKRIAGQLESETAAKPAANPSDIAPDLLTVTGTAETA